MKYTVYMASHRPTGSFYIGFTGVSLYRRMGQHWAENPNTRRGFHSFLHSTRPEEWCWYALESTDSMREARVLEQAHIIKRVGLPGMLNKQKRISGHRDASRYRQSVAPKKPASESTRRKQSLARKDRIRVMEVSSGTIFETKKEAAKFGGMDPKTLSRIIAVNNGIWGELRFKILANDDTSESKEMRNVDEK